MTLDDDGRTLNRGRLNHIRIERPLSKEPEAAKLFCPLLEHVDESATDDFALLFRIRDSSKAFEEQIARVDEGERKMQLVAESFLNLIGLVVPEQSIVNEDAREPSTNGAVNQQCCNRRVHASGQPADHLARRDPLSNPRG